MNFQECLNFYNESVVPRSRISPALDPPVLDQFFEGPRAAEFDSLRGAWVLYKPMVIVDTRKSFLTGWCKTYIGSINGALSFFAARPLQTPELKVR